jgi:hypothetical protein
MPFNFCCKKTACLRYLTAVFFLLSTAILQAQNDLIIENQTFTNSAETWLGVNVPRSAPTSFIFRNNTVTSSNIFGYQLLAGDETRNGNNNNLDGALITGNKFIWKGTNMQSITHAVFTGHNSNVTIKYNYLDQTPMGIIRKSSSNMSNSGGGVAYNIVRGGAVAVVVKGMSNVNIYNNTFYGDRTTSQTWRPLVHIYTNVDDGGYSVSHGTKIFNNIFYTKYQTFSITLDDLESLNGFQCDYNVYWCEAGEPRFVVDGVVKSFTQWQAMGFDRNSHVFNPKFKDLINFVPTSRLDFGRDLGPEWSTGLAVNARWGSGDPALATQDDQWQVGAVLYGEHTGNETNRIFISPNPARKHINILNLDYSAGLHTIRIYDLAGKLCFETELNPGDNNQIQIDLTSGIYVFQILYKNTSKFAERLIVVE